MTMTGDAAMKFVDGMRDKLKAMCDTSLDGVLAPPDERRAQHEWTHDVFYTRAMTPVRIRRARCGAEPVVVR